jgi:hypothetical protein
MMCILKLFAATLCHNDVLNIENVVLLLFVLFYVFIVCKCVLYYCHRVTTQLQSTNMSYHFPQIVNSQFPRTALGPKHKIYQYYIDNVLCGYDTSKAAVDCEYCEVL